MCSTSSTLIKINVYTSNDNINYMKGQTPVQLASFVSFEKGNIAHQTYQESENTIMT